MGSTKVLTLSINSHGAFSRETFTVPPDTYIYAPAALERPYELEIPTDKPVLEQTIRFGMLPARTDGQNWVVYQPGDQIPNLRLTPWSEQEAEKLQAKTGITAAPGQASTALNLEGSDKLDDRQLHGKVKLTAGIDLKDLVTAHCRGIGSTRFVLGACNSLTSTDPVMTLSEDKTISILSADRAIRPPETLRPETARAAAAAAAPETPAPTGSFFGPGATSPKATQAEPEYDDVVAVKHFSPEEMKQILQRHAELTAAVDPATQTPATASTAAPAASPPHPTPSGSQTPVLGPWHNNPPRNPSGAAPGATPAPKPAGLG